MRVTQRWWFNIYPSHILHYVTKLALSCVLPRVLWNPKFLKLVMQPIYIQIFAKMPNFSIQKVLWILDMFTLDMSYQQWALFSSPNFQASDLVLSLCNLSPAICPRSIFLVQLFTIAFDQLSFFPVFSAPFYTFRE